MFTRKLLIGVGVTTILTGALLLNSPAQQPTPDQGFVLRTAPFGANDTVAYMFQPSTGRSWHLQKGNWKPIKESGELSKGRYDLQIVSSGVSDQKTQFAYRIDQATGKSWFINYTTHTWEAFGVLTE